MKPESALSLINLLREKERLEKELRTDEITGLGNYKSLKENLNLYQGHSFGILFLDVDYFKLVNETHGHLAATGVLRQLGVIIGDFCSLQKYKAFRYAGDEFVLIVQGTHQEGLVSLAEVLRKRIERHLFNVDGHLGKSCIRITVSTGCRLAGPGDTCDGILSDADKALFEAKRKSRNTTVAFCS